MANERNPLDEYFDKIAQALKHRDAATAMPRLHYLEQLAQVRKNLAELDALRHLGMGNLGSLSTDPPEYTLGRLSDSPRTDPSDQRIANIAAKLKEKLSEVHQLRTQGAATEKKLQEIKELNQLKEQLAFVSGRISSEAEDVLVNSDPFRSHFTHGSTCHAFVLAVDLRRSTDLMLKAHSAAMFSTFITRLWIGLREIVIKTGGIFEKFTGDGILAFFPDFYSGDQAPLLTVETAERCHSLFREHYRASYDSFTAVPRDTGLGIGIDCGVVTLVQVANELAIVGTPVVYAARLSAAEAGITLLNQPAYKRVIDDFSSYVALQETSITMKHDGPHVCYSATRNKERYELQPLAWEQQFKMTTTETSDSAASTTPS